MISKPMSQARYWRFSTRATVSAIVSGLTFEPTLAYPPPPAGAYVLLALPSPASRAATWTVRLRLTSLLLQLLVGTRCRGPGQVDWSCASANTLSSAATATIQGFMVRIIDPGWRRIPIALVVSFRPTFSPPVSLRSMRRWAIFRGVACILHVSLTLLPSAP